MKRLSDYVLEIGIIVGVVGGVAWLVAANAQQSPPTAADVATLLEKYRDATVAFHKAQARELLAKSEVDTAYEVAAVAGVAWEAAVANMPTTPPVVTPPASTIPAGAVVLVRGTGPSNAFYGSVHSPFLPEDHGTKTGTIAWPGGSYDPQAIDASGVWTVEASLDSGAWGSTRSGVLWVDGTTDGDYQVRVDVFNVGMGTIDQSTVKPTIVLTRKTTNGVVTWTRK